MMANASRVFHRGWRGIACIRIFRGGPSEAKTHFSLDQRRKGRGAAFTHQKFLWERKISGALTGDDAGLLFQKTGMAGDALPAPFGKYPGIGEAADVLVWFGLIGALGAVSANHHGRVAIHADLQVLNG